MKATEKAHCYIHFTTQFDGDRYAIVSLNLPDCIGFGETRESAMQRFVQACKTLIQQCRETGEAPPWREENRPGSSDADAAKWLVLEI